MQNQDGIIQQIIYIPNTCNIQKIYPFGSGPAAPMRVKPSQQTPFLDAFLNRTNGRLRQRVPFRRFCAFWVHHPGLTLSLACVKYSSDFGHDLILPVALGLSRWLPLISICFHVHEQICSNRATSPSNKLNARFQRHLQF